MSNDKAFLNDLTIEYGQINIARTFNSIKKESSSESSENNENESNKTQNTQESKQNEIYQKTQKAVIQEHVNVNILNDTSNKKFCFENVDEKAKEILTTLYGSQWQTPENIKKLVITNSKSQKQKKLHNENNNNSIINPKKINASDTKRDNIISVLDKKGKELVKTNLISKFDETATSEKEIKKHKLPINKKTPEMEQSNIIKSATRSGRQIKTRRNWKDLLENEKFSDYECTDDSDVDATFNDLQFSSSDSISDSSLTKNEDEIIYLDLSCDVVKVLNKSKSPKPKHSVVLSKSQDPTSATPSRRKLFTPDSLLREYSDDHELIFGMSPNNKILKTIKTDKLIFKLPTSNEKPYDSPKPRTETQTPKTPNNKTPKTPKDQNFNLYNKNIAEHTSVNKYGFLKSLDVIVPKTCCDPDALVYRNSYRTKKEELTQRLYNLYNEKIFNNELKVEVIWNKKLLSTAGKCITKIKGNIRSSKIELSEKVLTSPDRLRCTLIHELCHAAAWILNGEHGHGVVWRTWANKANLIFQELPKIQICHDYDIEHKYTYKCEKCLAKSHSHSKSKKVENIRCAYCDGAIEIFLNKKDKEGNIVYTPVRKATGFAKFVQENYKTFKKPELTHGDVMKLLSSKYALSKEINK